MREMRDSGVEWIGEIPKDWNCCKQKYRFTLINGRAFKDNEFEEDGTYRILRVGNLFSNPVWYSSSLELEPDKYCEKGDLIYAWSMSYGPYIWNEEKVIYHYHIWKTKLVSDMDKMFSYYYLQALTESIKSQTHETTMGFVTMGIMNNSYIAYPRNIKEQKKISDYLDAKCSKIDEIIEKQLSIIEKLKEYKLSLITEVVTKGMNPNVEMRDSGYEYIGLVPYTWEICRLRNIGIPQNGISKGAEFFGEGYPFVSYGDVYRNYSLPQNVDGLIMSTEEEREQYSVREKDIFFTRTSETIEEVGFSSVCEETIPNATYAGFVIRVRPFNDKLTNGFAKYYFRGEHHRIFLAKEMNLVTRASLGQDLLKSMPVLVPPKAEQDQIAYYLDNKCRLIDKNIIEKQNVIEKLQEYKKSLIYGVVTGKKEI